MNKETYEFEVGILENKKIVPLGSFSKGVKAEERAALIQILTKHKTTSKGSHVSVQPGICIYLSFKGIKNDKLISASFLSFQLKKDWEECTVGNLLLLNKDMNDEVHITNPNKPLWNEPYLNKDYYISYLFHMSPNILPFLKDRLLTVIRYPHGVNGESFYQKSCPEYAPSFIKTKKSEDIHYILCNDTSSLIWLGNQLAIEYHIPFETIKTNYPIEIIFDLDPPSRDYFPLAVYAAKEMKILFDKFQIKSFPKLSGGKGLQIHIPVMDSPFTYEETRHFTEFIAKYLVEKFPEKFTIERMKKKRGKKLYIDYVQHWHGKTIISPYSLRARDKPTVAAPLYWSEVDEKLDPNDFTLFTMQDRIKKGCPFLEENYFDTYNENLEDLIHTLKNKTKRLGYK
ncbi:non-homologous end-joining DNA ligase [Bacillus alkalicola]|nr:non-homologous end-joining DNA ligase [Bacillus alkalicola]